MSEIVNPPPTLNGYPVVGFLKRTWGSGGFVVLVHRPEHFQPWVTAVWAPSLDTSWVWGHYMEDESDARQDMIDRAERPKLASWP